MGFTTGQKSLVDIINDIADGLIASSSNWVEGDGTWNTSVVTGLSARRCLKYTGDEDDIWFAFEIVNDSRTFNHVSDHRSRGFRLTISSNWDYNTNMYSGSTVHLYVGFEARSSNTPGGNMATLPIEYYMFIDQTGVVLMASPVTWNEDNLQSSFIFVIERMETQEYIDGQSRFYAFKDQNANWWHATSHDGSFKPHRVIRPFLYSTVDDNVGIRYWRNDHFCFKNLGDGKMYYTRPIVFNSTGETDPIGYVNMFIRVNEGLGVIDGDIIEVDNTTRKYLVKYISSPSSTGRLPFAMRIE
jgi:hypothetical protein